MIASSAFLRFALAPAFEAGFGFFSVVCVSADESLSFRFLVVEEMESDAGERADGEGATGAVKRGSFSNAGRLVSSLVGKAGLCSSASGVISMPC